MLPEVYNGVEEKEAIRNGKTNQQISDMEVFSNYRFGKVRTMMIDDEIWIVGKDVAEALGYKDTKDALIRHVDNNDKGVVKHDSLGSNQDTTIINESGLYSLIFSSKLP
ncbi:Bro-N domain-containing protein [Oceanotoga teriensis]|nr:Bro-N domain-containing protein [Oceanotoga teriensis]MDO7976743.1 Bro-N domain-containing protein [Oceanotoga teriensis]